MRPRLGEIKRSIEYYKAKKDDKEYWVAEFNTLLSLAEYVVENGVGLTRSELEYATNDELLIRAIIATQKGGGIDE